MNLSAFLKNRAKESPESVCVVHNSKRRTYAEIDRLSDALAVKLIENGLRKGERVVILLENSAEYIFWHIKISRGGCPGEHSTCHKGVILHLERLRA